MTTTELHALRSAQLSALADLSWRNIPPIDINRIETLCRNSGVDYSTRNLSDKALEEIQTLAGRYLEQVK